MLGVHCTMGALWDTHQLRDAKCAQDDEEGTIFEREAPVASHIRRSEGTIVCSCAR